MSRVDTDLGDVIYRQEHSGWRELWLKEDWWAIWLGLGIVVIAYLLFTDGSGLRWLAVTPARWSSPEQLAAHFANNGIRYLAQFIAWTAILSVAMAALGYRVRDFIAAVRDLRTAVLALVTASGLALLLCVGDLSQKLVACGDR